MKAATPDVIVYGSARFDDPWLTEHHLAAALARRTRVLYVDPPQSVLTPLRAGDLDGARRLRGLFRRGAQEQQGVQVLRPTMLPPVSNARARRWSSGALRRQTADAARRLGIRPNVVVTTRELFERKESDLPPFTVVVEKDWTRAGAHLTGVGSSATQAAQRRLWADADLVFATSRRLRERLIEDSVDTELLRHGFDASAAPAYEHLRTIPELAHLPRPVLGCVGRIDDRWSFSALAELAATFGGGSVVLAGPVNTRSDNAGLDALLELDNVHQFGPVSAADLPSWLSTFDCSLIPYTADEWQEFASPLKIWDYLYAGRAIAATGSPAMGEFPDGLVHYAHEPTGLSALVADALKGNTQAVRTARRAHALENTWDHRVEQLLAMVAEARSPGG